MKVLCVLVLFVVQHCYSNQIGTILLKTDRFIVNSLKYPEVGNSEQVLENARCFLENIRELRKQHYPDAQGYKKAFKITNALFSQDRPKFLNLKISSIFPKLKSEYGWTEEDVDKFTDLFDKSERIRSELYRIYKRTAYTEKPSF